MEIITGVERRRRWSASEKLRIVAETEQPGVGIAEIARRYEISRGLLWNWRSQVRRGVLRPEAPPVFLPVQMIREPANGEGAAHVEPSSAKGTEQAPDGKIEITLPDGTSIKVGHDVGLVALRRVMTVPDPEDHVQHLLTFGNKPRIFERTRPNGRIIEIRGNPVPG